MADFMYAKAMEGLLDGTIDLNSNTIKMVLCKSGYVANQASDQYLSSITSGNRIATVTLAGISITNGVFDATDAVFPSVAAGSTGTQLAIYQDASPDSSARLIAHIDSYTGLPVTTSGSDINISFPNDANKIFALSNA